MQSTIATSCFVWADGGPKHFGNTSFVDALLALQTILRRAAPPLSKRADISVLYFKFVANHGYGPCDGMAANGKRAVSSAQRSGETQVRTQAELESVLSGVGNWEVSEAPVPTTNGADTTRPRTWHGFRKFHVFGVEETESTAWSSAADYFAEGEDKFASKIAPESDPSKAPWLAPFNRALQSFNLPPYELPEVFRTKKKAQNAARTGMEALAPQSAQE